MMPLRLLVLLMLPFLPAFFMLLLLTCLARPLASEPCMPLKEREHIRELTLQAIDQGLINHVAKLFDVWLKDFSPEPKRAMSGMANGISAYKRARNNALNWNPSACGE